MGSRWSITSKLDPEREEVRRLAREAALKYGVNPDVLESLSFQESGFNRNALSSAGAEGPFQFMPATGAAYGLRTSQDRRDPVKSADAAARHVRDLLKRYNGNVDLALVGYNAGPGVADRVKRGGGMPRETRQYIPAIKAHFDRIASRGGFDAPSAPKASIPDIAAPKREYKDTGWIDGRPGSPDTQTRVESMRKPYEGPTDAPVAAGFELKESVPKPSVATVRVPSVAEAARTRVARQPGRNYVAEGAKALDAFGNAVLGGWRRPDSSMDRYEHAERQQAAARSTRAVSGSRMAGVFAPKGNVRPRTPLGQLPGADLVETPADRAVAAVAPPQRREIGLNARERGIPAPLRANETRPDWQDQAEVPDALPANAMQPDWADSGMAAQRPGAAVGGVFGGGRTAPAEEPLLQSTRPNYQPTDPEMAARARRNAMYPELAPEGWTGPDYARKQREAAGWSRIKDIATGEQHPYAKLASILGEFTWTPPNLDAESRAINDRATDEQFDRSALGRIGQVGAFLSNPTAAVGVFSTDDAVRRIKENKYFEPAARSLGPLENVGRGLVNAPGQVFQGLSNNLVRSRQQVAANPNAAVPGAVDVIGHLANATGQAPAALGALMLGGPIAAELGGGEGLAGAIGLGGLEAASGRPYGAQHAETPDEYLGRVARAATTGGVFPYATKALAPVVNPLVRGGEAAISKLGRFGQLIEPLAIPSRLGSGASMAAVGPVTAGLFGDPMPTVGQTVENVVTGIATGPEANRFRGVHPTLHPTDWVTQAKEAVQANRKALAVSRLAPDSKITFADDLFVESGGLRGSRHIGTIEGTTGGLDPIVTVRLGSGRSQQFNLQDLVRRGVEPGANPDVIMEGTIAANLELERARATSEDVAPDPPVIEPGKALLPRPDGPPMEVEVEGYDSTDPAGRVYVKAKGWDAPLPLDMLWHPEGRPYGQPALDTGELMRTEQQRAEAESRRAAERDAARAARTPVEPQRTAGDARTYLVRDEDGRHAMVTVKGDQIVRADEVTNPKRRERYQTESAVEVSRDEMDGLVRPDQFVDAGEAHRTQFVRDYDLARPLRGAVKETAPVVDVAGSTAAKQPAPTPNDVKRETLKPESITAGVESGNLVPYRDTQYLTDAPDVAARRNQTRLIDPQTNERLTFASPEAAEAFVNPSIVPRETVVPSPVEGNAAAPSTVPSEVPQPIAPQTAASGEAGATVPASSIVNPDGTVTRTFTDQRKDPATRNMVTALYSDEQLRAMTHDELIETIKRIQIEQRMHELTGIQNKIAYNEAVKKKVQTSIDLAGLKRANDTVNPEFGDIILTGAAELLVKHAGKDAFHVKGDEYIAQFNSKKEANKVMEAFRKELFESIFEYTMPNGKVRRFTGVDLYYEHGKTIVEADFKLNAAKEQRKLDATGRTPGRLVELPPTRRNVPDGETGRPGLSGSEDGAGSGADGSAGSARRNNVEPREGAGPVIRGRSGEIRIPGTTERVPFTYVIRDAGDVHASHTGLGVESGTFEYENDRRYDKPEDRARIENQARNYDTEQAHTDNPTPEVGPAIIDPRGNVLGGNSREMTTKRVYELHPENAAALRRSLAERAETFGISADEIASMDSMKRPQLYREIDPEYFATADPQKLIRDFNAPSTAKLTSGERAMSLARNVTPEALALISTKIGKHGEDGSVAQALSSDGPEIINKLIADGLITNQDRPELFGEDGAVNEKGRALVRDILIGKMFRDGDQLAMTQSGLKGKLERISSRYQRVENDPALAGFHIGDTLHDAIDLLNEAHARGTNRLELVYGQKSLLEAPRFSDDAIALARVLQQGPVNAAKAINGYYTEAIRSLPDTPGDLFGMFPATPDQARAEFLQGGEKEEGGPLAMAEDVEPRRVPSTLADHDLIVQGDKVLDVVPKGADGITVIPNGVNLFSVFDSAGKSLERYVKFVGNEEAARAHFGEKYGKPVVNEVPAGGVNKPDVDLERLEREWSDDAPPMEELLKAGQSHRLVVPESEYDAPVLYVNMQTADTIESMLRGKKANWAGLSLDAGGDTGGAMKLGFDLRRLARTLPKEQAYRANELAETLIAADNAATRSRAVSIVTTERRRYDGTLEPRPKALIQTTIDHEQHHAVQKQLSLAWTRQADSYSYLDSNFIHEVPGLETVLGTLKKGIYKDYSDASLAMEVFTHLSTSPDVSVLGVNRKQATELLRHFYDAVYDRYGREGVERFVKINEEAQGVRDEILTGQDTGKGERADARERQRASRGVSEGEGTGRNGSVREGNRGDGGPLAFPEGKRNSLGPEADALVKKAIDTFGITNRLLDTGFLTRGGEGIGTFTDGKVDHDVALERMGFNGRPDEFQTATGALRIVPGNRELDVTARLPMTREQANWIVAQAASNTMRVEYAHEKTPDNEVYESAEIHPDDSDAKIFGKLRKTERAIFGEDHSPLFASEQEDLSPAALKAKYFGTGQEREGAKSYGREATSFGRSSAKAKRIEPAKLEGGAVKPLKQIISDFADSIDRVIAKTKQKPKFLGTYWPRDTHIGIRNAGDLDTVAHEGAHALDDMHGIVAEWAYDENSPFDKELIPQFSQHGSRPPAGMDDVEARAYERAEGVAEWVRAYIMNPEAALTAAPKFAKFFTLKIPAEQHAAVRAFSKDVREFAGLRADKAIGANIRMDIPRQTFWKKLGLGDDWQATLSRELSDELAPAIAKWREVRGFRGLGAATPRADFERLARVLSGHDEKMEDIFANGIVDALNPVSRDKNGRVTVNRTTDGGIDWILAPADTTSRETVRSDMAAMARLTVAERQIGETDVLMEAAAKKADELAEKFGAKVQAKLDAEAKLREKAIEKTYNGRLRDAEKAREKALAKATTDKEKQKAVDLANRRIDEAAKRYEADRTKHAEWLSKAEAEMQTRVEEFADRASKRGEERAWNRAARLSGIGGGLKHDTEHAREAIEALKTEDPEQYARVSEMAARFRQTADAVLQYLDDMGRYSTEEIERFRQKKDYYTPFARVLGEDTPDTRAIGGGGKHLTSPAQLMKRFKGGTDQIENPFVSLLDKMYRSIKEADRNAVMEAFVSPMRLEREMYQGPPINTAQFGYRVEAPQEGSVKIFHKTVDDQGVATVETEHWMFPEETRASLKGLGEVGDMGFVWKFVTAPARMTRWGVVHAPGFLIRNIIRDPFVRIVHTNVNSHLRDSFKKFTGGEKSAFRIGGGGQAGLVETAKSDYDAMIEGAIDKLREDKKSVVLRPSQVWGVYKNLIRASEEQGRLAEFRKAYDHAEKVLGLDSRDATIYAASEARGLMDYAIAGRSIRRLTQLIPFVNPQVQGLKKTVNSLTTPGKRGGAAAKMMAYSIIPEIAAYVLNASQGEDVEEEYWQQPSYLRDTFWNVKIADDLWLRIPKPFELGLPASAVGRAIAAMRGDPHAMEGFGGVAFRMLAPVDPESLLTGGAGGVAGALLNRDIFRDQYVVDPNEEKLEIPLRKGTKNASRIGQLIQQASMDTIDSRQVDFIARSQFGGVGTLATQLSDIGREDRGRAGRQAAMTAGGLFAQSPATAARDVQFVLTTAEKKNESNSDLVEKLRDVKKAYNEATTREDRDRLAETMRQVAAEARQFYDANGSFLTEREQKSRDRNRGIREVREERRKTKLLSDYGVEEE